MYLSDGDLKSVISDIQFRTDGNNFPFDEEKQIQPASVDLRLSNIFWFAKPSLVMKRSVPIDIRAGKVMEKAPRRHWIRRILGDGEAITIRPLETISARTHERFKIPPEYCGVIYGRSSFSRLGLSVSLTGMYINPNWQGHFPLQLTNLGPYPITIVPYIPICQLCLVRLSNVPSLLYGDKRLESKYVDDDGGPSYWWRDSRIEAAKSVLRNRSVSLEKIDKIEEKLAVIDLGILDRFETHAAETQVQKFEIESVLDKFAKAENFRRIKSSLFKWALVGTGPVVLTLLSVIVPGALPLSIYNVLGLAALGLGGLSASIWGFFYKPPVFLSPEQADNVIEELSKTAE